VVFLTILVLELACSVKVVSNVESSEVISDLLISLLIDEINIGYKLMGELGVALEDIGRGLWGFRWEDRTKVRINMPLKYWRTP